MPYYHETTPDKEADIARQALSSGDLSHAAYHIGTALAFDPTRGDWLGVLHEVVQRASDPLVLLRLDANRADFVTAATRGYVLALRGQLREAIELVVRAAEYEPAAPFLIWAADWIRRPGVAASYDDRGLLGVGAPLAGLASNLPVNLPKDHVCYRTVEAAAAVLRGLLEAHPNHPKLLFITSIVERRLGQFDWATYHASQAFQLDQNWNSAVGVALCSRDAGKIDDAASWFRYAQQLDGSSPAALHDLGDMYVEAKRYDEAVAVFDEVIAGFPDSRWAPAAKLRARYRQTKDIAFLEQLFALAERSGDAWTIYSSEHDTGHFVTGLPWPAEAAANALRDLYRQIDGGGAPPSGQLDIGSSHHEAPSVLTAHRLWARSRGGDAALRFKVETHVTPDPRTPKAPNLAFTLWRYEGDQPIPNLGTPDARALEAVASIARTPYNLHFWAPKARAVAPRFGPAWMQHFAAVMLYPPPLPERDMDPFQWVQRCQIATALILAYLDEGWDQSARKAALYALILGPVDWSTDAGVIALAWLGREDDAIRQQATALFDWLAQQIPGDGFTSFEYPLVTSWLGMGHLDDAQRTRLQQWAHRIAAKNRSESAQDAGPEKHGGLTLEQYAELSVRRDAIVAKHGGGILKAGLAAFGGGSYPELAALCREFGIDPDLAVGGKSAAAGRIPEWDQRINADGWVQEQFMAMCNDARLKLQGFEFNSHEGRVAEAIRSGTFDTDAAMVNAQAAAEQMRQGQGGDPDPVVFPGQPLAKLSDYVGLMKGMQTGDMMGALRRYGLDMGSYMTAAQAWGVKLASDPVLSAKFAEMMAA